jgi:hypothetical protein
VGSRNGRSDPSTRGCDLLTDSARPLMGGRTPLDQFWLHTDTGSSSQSSPSGPAIVCNFLPTLLRCRFKIQLWTGKV